MSTVAAVRTGDALSRPVLFGVLLVIAFVNAIGGDAAGAVRQEGLLSLLNAFDVSFFIWAAFGAGLLLVTRSRGTPASSFDRALAFGAGVLLLVPIPELSWVVVTILALSLLMGSSSGSSLRRGAAILLALTIPTLWAPIAMSVFSEPILAADAMLVSLAVGSERVGNMVPFADQSGAMWIAPDCSSFTNISLTILAFVTVVNVTSGTWTAAKLALGLAACVLVVLVNATRISLVGYYPQHFDLIHGTFGATLAGWATTLIIIGISWYAVRRDALALG